MCLSTWFAAGADRNRYELARYNLSRIIENSSSTHAQI